MIATAEVPNFRTAFNLDAGPSLLPAEAHELLLSGAAPVELRGGMALRVSTVMGAKRIELTGFRDTEVEQLKSSASSAKSSPGACGSFLPLDAAIASETLSRLFPHYPRLPRLTLREARRPPMSTASELSRRLGEQAEAVCRAYLPNGRRSGRYWIIGDTSGTRGRSLFVKLVGEGAGRWTDSGDRRIWRSSRPHPAQQGLERLPRSHCRSAIVPARARARLQPARSRPALKSEGHRLPPSACSPSPSPFPARLPKPICGAARSPPASIGRPCDITRHAGTA